MPEQIFNARHNFDKLGGRSVVGIDFSNLDTCGSSDYSSYLSRKAGSEFPQKLTKNNGRVCSLKFQLVPLV